MEKIYKHSLSLMSKLLLCVSFVFVYSSINAQCGFVYSSASSYATCETSADGTANLKVWGGTLPHSITWDNGQTAFFATGLTAGIHYATVTDATGCSEVTSVTVEPGPESIWLMPEATCASCGSCNGTAEPHAMLGIPPYSYLWDNGQTTEVATGLCPGTHFVTVTDTQGCSSVGEVFVCTDGNLTVNCSGTNPSCGGGDGSVTAVPSGGLGPFTYSWNNGSSTSTLSNVDAGTYSVTVTDADGCQGICSTTITGTTSNLSVNISTTPTACGESNGTATANVSGSTGNVNYSWNTGATTNTITGLGAGMYTVTVVDASGCSATGSGSVIGSNAPVAPAIFTNDPTEYCDATGAGVIVNASTNGACANSAWVLTDLDANILAIQTDGTFDFSGLGTGGFQIWLVCFEGTLDGAVVGNNATDLSGCFDLSDPITISITTVAPPTISTTDELSVCVGDGSSDLVDVSVDEAGTGDINQWVITDENGIILELPTNPPFDFEGAPAGTCLIWLATATGPVTGLEAGADAADITGCYALSNSIAVVRNETPTVSIDPVDVELCMGETVDLTATGSSDDLTYEWFASQGQLSSSTTQTTTFTMMAPGTYQIILSATSPDGCMAMDMTTVTILAAPTVSISVPGTICEVGDCVDLEATADGGNTFTYEWTAAQGMLSDDSASATEFCMGMAGTYDVEVTVTNENGCTASASTTVIVGTFEATVNETLEISECGESDGEATVDITGGNGDFTYEWSNGSTDASASGLAEGCYQVTITDNLSGCTRTGEVCLDDGGIDVGNYVWWDNNENCEQDSNENGAYGVPVSLMTPGPDGICGNADDEMAPNGSTNTDSDGYYLFECVPVGTFYIQFGATIVYTGTEYTCRDGASDVTDSDVDEDGKSHMFDVVDTDGDGQGDIIDTNGDGVGDDKEQLSFDAGIFQCCNDVNFGGQVSGDQSVCQGEVPDLFTSTIPAGGGGAKPIEYLWICSTQGGPADPNTWTELPNSNSETYQAGPVYQTKHFARCARRECCDAFLVESNIITVEVLSCLQVITFTVEELRGDNEAVRISWITNKDFKDMMYFVERSTDGANYEVIGELPSVASNNSSLNLYEHMDNAPHKGMNYYRIRLVNPSGDFDFTETKMVEFAPFSENNFEIFPNPVTESMSLESFIEIDGAVELEIISTSGKLFNKSKVQTTSYMNEPIDIKTLPAGSYYLRITHGDNVEMVKFTKIN